MPTRCSGSTSPNHSMAFGWTSSADSKAVVTQGPSGGLRKSPGSHPSMTQGAAATVSRHARRGPVPLPSATASTATGSPSGAAMRACRTRGPCGCASACSRHGSSGPRSGAGVANAPAAAISRPYARVTWSTTSERVDRHHCPVFAVQCSSPTARFPRNCTMGRLPPCHRQGQFWIRPPAAAPSTVEGIPHRPASAGEFSTAG